MGLTQSIEHLNLARKWRSKNFEQIIGQDLSLRILKNSLYLDHYFPVYLFAGQRGCGKTTTARVFAAAINCQYLPDFQKNPKAHLVPCLNCSSCVAMMTGKHPDFIEIDAASNTGVDNVRHIIDAASFLPLLGRKKIYLIDEAHMLSKAAFNAFLKLLEEPPVSVLFILATTDTEKIIETVRSRCFQVFFNPIEESTLVTHLAAVCASEHIAYEPAALHLIAKETEGSARDALNLLERVRFASSQVTKQVVQQVLGHLDDSRIVQCFDQLLNKNSFSMLQFINEQQLESFSAPYIWNKLVEVARAAIWVKHGITPRAFTEYIVQLHSLVKSHSVKKITDVLEMLYANESLFLKTTSQHAFLEMILLQLCQKNENNSNSGIPSVAPMPVEAAPAESLLENDEQEDDTDQEEENDITDDEEMTPYTAFVTALETHTDPLIASIFKQIVLVQFTAEAAIITLGIPKEISFFHDMLLETQQQWKPHLTTAFAKECTLTFTILEHGAVKEKMPLRSPAVAKETLKTTSVPVVAKPAVRVQSAPIRQPFQRQNGYKNGVYARKEKRVDVTDAQQWPTANLLLQYFPGIITEISENV